MMMASREDAKTRRKDSVTVPSGWEFRRLKYVGTVVSGTGFPHEYQGAENEELPFLKVSDMSASGSEKWVSRATNSVSRLTAQELGATVVPKNSVVYAKIGAALLLNKRRLLTNPSCIDNNMSAFVPRAVVPEWALWWLTTLDFGEYVNPGAIPSFTEGQQKELPFLVPPLETQRLITDYLDRETARIDALVTEKEKMLALLEEKRAALISSKVTRGLDESAPLKPSGLDWLGDIPAHWDVERAKNLFSVRDQRSVSGEEELLTVSHITGVTSRSEKDVYMFQADDKAGYKLCYPGDLVINTLWGWMGAMGISPLEGIVSPDYHVYTSKGLLLPEFVELLCRSKPFVAEVNRWSKGVWSSRLRLYPENFFEMRLPVPPHEVQRDIIAAVEESQGKTKELAGVMQQSITLAKERRAALITASVTGQISVEEMRQ